ncbi:MAG: hypothetical protein PVH61_35695 [Candidatus Aminicenantes bacterium]|jgi:hypothetical protein
MKRKLILILVIFLGSVFISAQSVMLSVTGNRISIADSEDKALYGGTRYFPEGKIALRLKGNFYLWGSLGFFSTQYDWEEWSNKGVVSADTQGKNVLNKLIISGGLGYYMGFLRKNDISVKFEVGVCRITNSIELSKSIIRTNETVSFEEQKEAGIGIRGNLGITYGLYKNIYAEITGGYLLATDRVDDNKVKLGGFQLTMGLGLAF